MHTARLALCALAALGVSACNNKVTGPAPLAAGAPADGFVHYSGGGSVVCDRRPVSFDGSHARIEASGSCTAIRVTGEHSDIIVEMAPGGLMEATGAHNDIWWRTARPGPPPVFRNTGVSNSVHRDDG